MLPRVRASAAITVLVTLVLSGCGGAPTSSDPVVRVAAASDLMFALDEVIAELADADPPLTVRASYGSSGQLVQQIENGAPYDVYLSADITYAADLAASDLATVDAVFPYALGRLVMWVTENSPLDLTRGVSLLADPAVRQVSVANPQHAPYGQAAVAAMMTAEVYETVEPKLVLGENVAQAAEFVDTGNADVGLIALSLALSPHLAERGHHVEVPPDLFPPLSQGGVVLSGADDLAAAERFRNFLTGPEGLAILERYGFLPPDEPTG